VVALVTFCCFCLTPTATGTHHLALVSGLPQLVLARCLTVPPLDRRLQAALVGALTICLVAANVVIVGALRGPYRNLSWERATSEPASFALTHPNLEYHCIDWGLCTQLVALTHGRVHAVDSWPEYRDPSGAMRALAGGATTVPDAYVVRAEGAEAFPDTRRNFFSAAASQRVTLRRMAVWGTDSGRPVVELYIAESPTSTGQH
jgi:hypothetical protein